MKQVKKSKEPTLKQLLNMAANLQEKFDKAVAMGIDAWHYSTIGDDANRANFGIYVEDREDKSFKSWEDCFDYYLYLMERKDV